MKRRRTLPKNVPCGWLLFYIGAAVHFIVRSGQSGAGFMITYVV